MITRIYLIGNKLSKENLNDFTIGGRSVSPTTVTIRLSGKQNYLLEKYIFLKGGTKRDLCTEFVADKLKSQDID